MMIVAMPIIETDALVIKYNIFLPATVVQWTTQGS